MSFLLESRKINAIDIPLYFKFSTIPTKPDLTTDKFLTLDNWLHIFDELNPLLASDPNNDPKKRKSFEMDSGRLSVKAKWVKISDSCDMGTHIVKILSLSSSSVGRYFLKIDIKLSSYLERIASEWEQKSKSIDVKRKSKESSNDLSSNSSKSHDVSGSSSTKHKKYNNRKISDMLPKVTKEKHDSPSFFDETATANVLDDLLADDFSKVEEYIPFPLPTPSATSSFLNETPPTYKSCSQTEVVHSEYSPSPVKVEKSADDSGTFEATACPPTTATYNPEKKLSQIEMNKIESEYSPTYLNDKSKTKDGAVYKPTSKGSKSSDTDKSKKVADRSKELFGSSDENYDDDRDAPDKVSSSSLQKSKRRMDSSPRREKKSSKERSKSKKKKFHDVRSSSQDSSQIGDISIRNLMNEPIDAILRTYSEHESFLTELYEQQIKQLKRNYKPLDIPDMTALDIVSPEQFTEMISFLEGKLVSDAEKEHNYSDVIFDSLIPEWTLAIFCKKFHCSKSEAIERLRLQAAALINSSQL